MVLSAQELFANEKMATAGMGNKKIATTLGLNSDREAHSAKTRHLPLPNTDTDSTRDTDNTYLPEVGPSPDSHMGPGARVSFPKNHPNGTPRVSFFFFERPASGRKHSLKMREPF